MIEAMTIPKKFVSSISFGFIYAIEIRTPDRKSRKIFECKSNIYFFCFLSVSQHTRSHFFHHSAVCCFFACFRAIWFVQPRLMGSFNIQPERNDFKTEQIFLQQKRQKIPKKSTFFPFAQRWWCFFHCAFSFNFREACKPNDKMKNEQFSQHHFPCYLLQ